MPYCKRCGAYMNEGDRFCPKCGFDNWSNIENQPSSQPASILPSKMELDVGPRVAEELYPEMLTQQKSMMKMFIVIFIIMIITFVILAWNFSQSAVIHMP